MARKSATPVTSTPATLKKQGSGSGSGQKSISSFFSKTPATANTLKLPERTSPRKAASKPNFSEAASSRLTPVPSSDAPIAEDDEDVKASAHFINSLPSPVSTDQSQAPSVEATNGAVTPSRRVRCPTTGRGRCTDNLQAKTKKINYVESDSEGTDSSEVFKSKANRRQPPTKRRKVSESADEDIYEQENEVEEG